MSAFKLELLNGEELERVGIVVSMLPKCHVKTVMTSLIENRKRKFDWFSQ